MEQPQQQQPMYSAVLDGIARLADPRCPPREERHILVVNGNEMVNGYT
jgi:hypothetical protein